MYIFSLQDQYNVKQTGTVYNKINNFMNVVMHFLIYEHK